MKNSFLRKSTTTNVKKIEHIETNEAQKQEFDNICRALGINEMTETKEIIQIIKRVSFEWFLFNFNQIFSLWRAS